MLLDTTFQQAIIPNKIPQGKLRHVKLITVEEPTGAALPLSKPTIDKLGLWYKIADTRFEYFPAQNELKSLWNFQGWFLGGDQLGFLPDWVVPCLKL